MKQVLGFTVSVSAETRREARNRLGGKRSVSNAFRPNTRVDNALDSLVVTSSASFVLDKDEAVLDEAGQVGPEVVGNSLKAFISETISLVQETTDEVEDQADGEAMRGEGERSEPGREVSLSDPWHRTRTRWTLGSSGVDTYMIKQMDPPERPPFLPQPETWEMARMVGAPELVGSTAVGLEPL